MSIPRIDGFLIDDENEDKFGRHGLSPRAILQVLENEHVIVPNRKRRRARYLLIGRDNGGACLAIPVEPTREAGIWRPITAWRCKPAELAKLD